MKKRLAIQGACPETSRLLNIVATYEIIPLCGDSREHLKLMSYFCEYADEHGCPSRQSDGMGCPLYQQAKSRES